MHLWNFWSQKSAMHHILSQFIPIHVISSYFNIIFPLTKYIPNHFLYWYFQLKYCTNVSFHPRVLMLRPSLYLDLIIARTQIMKPLVLYIYLYLFPSFFFLKYRDLPEPFQSPHVLPLNLTATSQNSSKYEIHSFVAVDWVAFLFRIWKGLEFKAWTGNLSPNRIISLSY